MIEKGSDQCNGLSSVLSYVGHKVYQWDIKTKPAFDAFDEFEPEVFLYYEKSTTNNATTKCLAERNIYTKSISDYQAADTFRFRQGKVRKDLTCDIACLIDETTTAKQFDTLVRPMINEGFNVKVVGRPLVKIPQYLGEIQDDTLCDLYASAKVCAVISHPKSVFDIFIAGGLPVAMDNYITLHIYGFDIVSCSDINTYIAWLRTFSNNKKGVPQFKLDVMKDTQKNIKENTTYWHMAANLFRNKPFEMNEEADRIMGIYNETFKL